MQEFEVNDYLKVKLENGETNIYVKDQLFRQCKFLLLDIPVDKISSFEEIESIDEATERLDRTLEKIDDKLIPSDVEFWGFLLNYQDSGGNLLKKIKRYCSVRKPLRDHRSRYRPKKIRKIEDRFNF